ncbi:MAG: methylmalonyl Co-A mutase-associated GTPase MeaB [Burkholderiales bacterium]|nr:methylmalonyl Co-A mutase-associated GTPase MeaB [Burkholderiales bacterium]
MTLDPRAAALAERALAGDRRAIARLLTLFDDDAPGAREAAATMAAHAGKARIVGVTGVPGSGKSTLVNALLGAWLDRGLQVGVVAFDPSSPISGGAVLGDRIRMGEHGANPNAFVRSFSARGELGGLSRAARAAIDCFDAAGFDRVIVETVGTGQSETRIAALADSRVVVCPPGLGDDVQALKAGTLEIADVLAVSKGDLPLAEQTAQEMREMLSLRRSPAAGTWKPRVVVVRALAEGGITGLLEALEAHALSVEAGRRLREGPGRRLGAIPDPASIAAGDADGWRARLQALAERDGLCATLGITVLAGGPGRSEVAMTVDARHLNFNGGCHGGALFSLADSAFGLASNSHGPLASGIDAHITFQAGVRAGQRLVARASEVSRSRRIAVYRIDVVRPEGDGGETAVSSFTGTVSIKA